MQDPVTTLPTATEGIAAETAALSLREPITKIWRSAAQSIVMPWHFSRNPGFEAAAAQAQALGWPVVLRPTGGGAVPQGPGVINLAMVWRASQKLSIEDAYRALCAPIAEACADFGVTALPGATEGSFCDGAFNLSVEGRKIVGTAQRWRSQGGTRAVLAHAMILTEPPAATAIAAINLLHRGLGLDLPVRAEVHTGLGACAEGLSEIRFAERLDLRARAALARLCP